MQNITLFSGDAASFKGRRSYVHGTDILPFIDDFVAARDKRETVTNIEFSAPLRTRGVLVINPDANEINKGELNVSGTIGAPGAADVPFIAFSTPIAINPEIRPFEEEGLWIGARLSDAKDSVAAGHWAQLTTAEHLSSLMKLLCQNLLPQHRRWWFVRLKKATMLPDTFATVEITCKRIVAKSMVSADISFDGSRFGSIDFVGTAK
jgi:hypothetical protein